MSDGQRVPVREWTVDYGDGREERHIHVPHAWKQEIPVSCEGPVIYRTTVDVPKGVWHLHFDRVSYAAEVSVDGGLLAVHKGIWDSFDVALDDCATKRVQIEVKVIKNGGETYPVRDVASGFLPYVFNTFGGIYGEVDLVEGTPHDLAHVPFDAHGRCSLRGSKIFVDEKPFYPRGALHWGWYPELGHPNPPADAIRREILAAKSLGFNLIKFCLWLPPHEYLELMDQEGMEAWLELPLWNPSPDRMSEIAGELESIVRQYRWHDNVLLWTVGCELGSAVSPEFREHLTSLVTNLSGSPLVKDDSGGAEMYGNDPREFGGFYDFHPYADTPFYGGLLDALAPGPRQPKPTLLGEFNDCDAHRDLAKLGDEIPYWGSSISELNARGVRWQYDLPELLVESRFSQHPTRSGHADLLNSSRSQALFVRKTVQEIVRARDWISGYVITGFRDTPISTSGFFDDWDSPRFTAAECLPWNGDAVLFRIPIRRPPWVNGGNRPGFVDSSNFFAGPIFWRIGVHSDHNLESGLLWQIRDDTGTLVSRGSGARTSVPALISAEVAEIHWDCSIPGTYTLHVEFAGRTNSWPIWVVPQPLPEEFADWSCEDPGHRLGLSGQGANMVGTSVTKGVIEAIEARRRAVLFLHEDATNPCPFWREAAYEFREGPAWNCSLFRDQWSRVLPISPDRTIDLNRLEELGVSGNPELLINRVDTRTYKDSPVMVRFGDVVVTTLRPDGGLGNQPTSLRNNPAGYELLRSLLGAGGVYSSLTTGYARPEF